MRTSIVLGVIAAALLAFILIFERGTVSTGEREKRQGSVLPELVRARVSRIEIQRKGKVTTLARDLDAEEDENALWRVVTPFEATADREAVDTLLSELEWLHGARRLDDISAADEKLFGFAAPRYRLWFTVGSERIGVVVGNETPAGDGVYVRTSEKGTAFVVGKDFAETLDHEPEHYHSKLLHDGLLFTTARALVVRDGGSSFTVRKREDGLWALVDPPRGLASTDEVVAVIDALDGLRASRFVAATVKDLARYGLAPARRELTLLKRDVKLAPPGEKAKEQPEKVDVKLRVGGPCEGHPGESYVVMGEAGTTLMCALDADLDKVQRSLDAMRSKRLLPLDPSNVHGVTIERGDAKLVLAETDGGHRYTLTRSGKTVAEGSAREDSVKDWLQALHSAEASSLEPQQMPGGARAWKATFTRDEGEPAFSVQLSMDGPSEGLALRGDDAHALAFPLAALELLEPSAARFRSLLVVDAPSAPLERLEARRGDVVERVSRKSAEAPLRVVEPIEAEADRILLADIARLLGKLEAVRFVSDDERTEHGLATPALTASATLGAQGEAPARTLVLRIGEATEGGRFAALEGMSGVFVISTQLADLLSSPLVSRTLLATPVEQLRSLEIERGAQPARIEKAAGGGFVDPTGALDGEKASRIASALATLRAQSVVGYGPAPQQEGFASPSARVNVQLESGSYALELGATAPDGSRYARRTDVAARFTLPASAVAGWLIERSAE